MRRNSGRSRQIIIWVVSLTVALSMACSFIPTLLGTRRPIMPTPTATLAPSPTPTATPQP